MDTSAGQPEKLFAAQHYLLRERLFFFLSIVHPILQADIIYALQGPGKLLIPSPTSNDPLHRALPAGAWSLLTLLVAQHISPTIDTKCASSVAVAVECYICALDLLDDVEDGDQTPVVQALGVPRVLNVSTALLMLAQRALLSLSELGVAPALILRLLDTLAETTLVATGGQHRDLLDEQQAAQAVTYEDCIEIATAKAGSLVRLACRMGALCANADEELYTQFSQLGELLGIAHQLDNDCHDLYDLLHSEDPTLPPASAGSNTRSFKTDLVRGKKTLPVVLAASSQAALYKTDTLADEEREETYLRELHEGIIATWGICMLYRERARDCLQAIEARQPVAPILRLLLGL